MIRMIFVQPKGAMKATVMFLLLFLCNRSLISGDDTKLDRINYGFWGPPQIADIISFVGQEKGFFRDEGIDFNHIAGYGSTKALQQLIAGQLDVVNAGPESTLIVMSQSGVKLKGIYNTDANNPFVIAARKSKGIQKFTDIKGHVFGVGSMASVTRWNALLMLKSNGMSERDVQLVDIGGHTAFPALMLENRIDAASSRDTVVALLKKEHPELYNDLALWWLRDFCNSPGNMYVTSEQVLTKKRNILVRFLRAVRRSHVFVSENVEESARIAKKYATDGQDYDRNVLLINTLIETSRDEGTKLHGLGWYSNYAAINKVIEFYNELGIIKISPIAEDVFTNELLIGIPIKP